MIFIAFSNVLCSFNGTINEWNMENWTTSTWIGELWKCVGSGYGQSQYMRAHVECWSCHFFGNFIGKLIIHNGCDGILSFYTLKSSPFSKGFFVRLILSLEPTLTKDFNWMKFKIYDLFRWMQKEWVFIKYFRIKGISASCEHFGTSFCFIVLRVWFWTFLSVLFCYSSVSFDDNYLKL